MTLRMLYLTFVSPSCGPCRRGEKVGCHPGLPVGGHEADAVGITEGNRTPGYCAASPLPNISPENSCAQQNDQG